MSATPMPSRVPAMRPRKDDCVAFRLSCETINADIAAQSA